MCNHGSRPFERRANEHLSIAQPRLVLALAPGNERSDHVRRAPAQCDRLPGAVRLAAGLASMLLLFGATIPPVPNFVSFSRAEGVFVEPFTLELHGPAGSVIRYTVDGSDPAGADGITYRTPLRIETSTRVRAVAVTGQTPGPLLAAHYIRISRELLDYTSPLPIMVVETFAAGGIPHKGWNQMGVGIRQQPRQPAAWMTWERVEGRSAIADAPQMISGIGIRGRGAASASWPEKAYGVEGWDAAGEERNLGPLGLPPHADWVLYYPYADTVDSWLPGEAVWDPTLLFNSFAWELNERLGRTPSRFRWVEAFINEDGAPLGLQHRRGVYAIVEKVARGRHRLDFRRLSEDGSSGGWLVSINRMDAEYVGGWPAPNGAMQPQYFHTAGRDRIQETPPNERGRGDDEPRPGNTVFNFDNPGGYRINPAQRAAIEGWFRDFEDVLWNDSIWRDPVRGYRAFIDTTDFARLFMIHELTRNGDAMGMSLFPWKGNDGVLRMGPAWDFNWAAYYTGYDLTTGETLAYVEPKQSLMHRSSRLWFGRLFSDPEFLQMYVRDWQALRRGVLSNDSIIAIIDRQAAEITPEKAALNGPWTPEEWTRRLDTMKRWLTERASWLDEQYRCPAWGAYIDVDVRCRVTLTAETLPVVARGDGCERCGAPVAVQLEDLVGSAVVHGSRVPLEVPRTLEWRPAEPGGAWRVAPSRNPGIAPADVQHAGGALRVLLGERSRNFGGLLVGGIHAEVPVLNGRDWSALVVRARGTSNVTRIGPRYNLRPGTGTETDAPNPFITGGPDQAFTGGEEARSYRFSTVNMPDSTSHLGVWIFASADAGSVEIESIALEPAEVPYRNEPIGARLLRARRTLHVHAPARVEYAVRVPEQGWISVGLGVLRGSAPVGFSIDVQLAGGATERVLSESWSDPLQWADRVVSLARFSGREVTLVLEARAEREGTVAFWAEPTLGGWSTADPGLLREWRFDGAGSEWRAVSTGAPGSPAEVEYTGAALRATPSVRPDGSYQSAFWVALPDSLAQRAAMLEIDATNPGGTMVGGVRYNLREGGAGGASATQAFHAGHVVTWMSGGPATYRILLDDRPRDIRELGLSFLANRAEARVEISAIRLLAAPQPLPSRVVRRLTAVPGDGSMTLRWQRVVGATGYAVYASNQRFGTGTASSGARRFTTADTTWTDPEAAPGTTRHYAVAPLTSGGEGDLSGEISALTVQARPPEVLQLEIRPDSLELLYARDAWSDAWVPVRLRTGTGLAVAGAGIRLAGSSSRANAKKSLHILLPGRHDFNFGGPARRGGDHVVLNGLWTDPSAMRESISMEMYRVIGRPAPATRNVDVYINGIFEGHYLSMERVDREALRGWGLRAGAGTTLVRDETKVNRGLAALPQRSMFGIDIDSVRGSDAERIELLQQIFDERGSLEEQDWEALLELVRWARHAAPGPEFVAEFERRFDRDQFLDLLALHVLSGDWDSLDIDYWLHRDSRGDQRWRIIPWDKDLSFGKLWSREHRGGANDFLDYDWFYLNPIQNRVVELLLETTELRSALHARVDSLALHAFPLAWYQQQLAQRLPLLVDGAQRTRGPGAYEVHSRQHHGEAGYLSHHLEALLDVTERRYRFIERKHRDGGVAAYQDRVTVGGIRIGESIWLTGTDGFTIARIVPMESRVGETTISAAIVDAADADGVKREYLLESSRPFRAEVTFYYRNTPRDSWLDGSAEQLHREWQLDAFETGGTAPVRLRSRANPYADAVTAQLQLGGRRAFRLLFGP
jgi:spore coat protein H